LINTSTKQWHQIMIKARMWLTALDSGRQARR
jgi:hypothetical protein